MRAWVTDPTALEQLQLIAEGFPRAPLSSLDPILWKALTDLRDDPHIYITPADKGGTLVIWRSIEYEREANRQLSDVRTYREISQEMADEYLLQLGSLRRELTNHLLMKKWITKREASAIYGSPCEAAPIYFLPKIHKGLNPRSNTFPGRPIVSTIKSTLHLLDKYLANITASLLTEIPGSLRDTMHLLSLLPTAEVPADATLLAVDVNALYPSIPWEEGVQASIEFYKLKYTWLLAKAAREGTLDPPDPQTFGLILRTILENSVISYKGSRFFHQIKGTSMGACISVYFANCYMWKVTESILTDPPPFIKLFLRFIDDILILSTGRPEQIDETLRSISNDNITYSSSIPGRQTEFLDLLITINDRTSLIETAPFSKPSASPSYLHAKSMHPHHLIKSIPFAQLIRLRRNASNTENFLGPARKLLNRFASREYDRKALRRTLSAVLSLDRRDLLFPKRRTTKFRHAFKFIVPFDFRHDWNLLRGRLAKLLKAITNFYSDSPISDELSRRDIKLIFRRASNLSALFTPKIKNRPLTSSRGPPQGGSA